MGLVTPPRPRLTYFVFYRLDSTRPGRAGPGRAGPGRAGPGSRASPDIHGRRVRQGGDAARGLAAVTWRGDDSRAVIAPPPHVPCAPHPAPAPAPASAPAPAPAAAADPAAAAAPEGPTGRGPGLAMGAAAGGGGGTGGNGTGGAGAGPVEAGPLNASLVMAVVAVARPHPHARTRVWAETRSPAAVCGPDRQPPWGVGAGP